MAVATHLTILHTDHLDEAGLRNINTVYSADKAKAIATALNQGEEDGWLYIAVEISSGGLCAVYAYDDEGYKVGAF